MSKVADKERKLRVVVSKDANKTRQNKSSSFDLTDPYEVDLLNYAEDPDRGNYSEFIKRLIAWHKEGAKLVRTVPVTPVEVEEIEDDAMEGFL